MCSFGRPLFSLSLRNIEFGISYAFITQIIFDCPAYDHPNGFDVFFSRVSYALRHFGHNTVLEHEAHTNTYIVPLFVIQFILRFVLDVIFESKVTSNSFFACRFVIFCLCVIGASVVLLSE